MSLVEPEWAKRQAEQRNASPDRALGTPHLRSMRSTAELARRPSRPPDYAAENRALIVLAQVMATSPDAVLQKLADTALTLCHADSAGLSLLEEGDQKSNFHWRAIARAVGSSHKRRNTAQLRPVRHGPRPRRRDGMLPSGTRLPLLGTHQA
jgi:hypothetical protein